MEIGLDDQEILEVPKTFDPIRVGPVELKNRIVAEPMMSNSDIGGYVTRNMLRIYSERAAGGSALVTVEATAILKNGRPFETPGIWDDDFIPGLATLADAIHRGGAKASIQLLHAGRQGNADLARGPVVAPSDHTPAWAGRRPHGLSTSEVEEIIEAYARAAGRAKSGRASRPSFSTLATASCHSSSCPHTATSAAPIDSPIP